MQQLVEQAEKPRLQLILCANEADADAIKDAGYKSVRVVTKPEDLYRYDGNSRDYELDNSLSFFAKFVLAFPADQSDLRDDIAVRLGDVNCTWVELTDDCPTPAALAEAGIDHLQTSIVAAKPMWTDEICRMTDVPDSGPEKTYKTGLTRLDDAGIRLTRPAFMPVIGPYGSGKSVLLRQLCVNLWRKHGWRTLLTSFEEKIKPRYQRELRRNLIAKPMNFWTDEDVGKADIEIDQAFRFLRRKRRDVMDLPRLMNRIEYAVKVYGVEVVIIDPVNEIDHEVPKGMSKTDYMGQFIMQLKALADDYSLLMIVAAHPPKDGVEKRLSKGRLLTLNDGADTAHWGNKADIGWVVWRPEFDGPTLLHIDKVKDHESMGKPTLAKLELDTRMNQFRVSDLGYQIMEAFE